MGIYLSRDYIDWIDGVKVLQKCAVVNGDGKILALKRNDDDYSRPGKWDLPGGNLDAEDISRWKKGSGKGDEDDILVRAMKREVEEETGLKVMKGSIKPDLSASGFNEGKKILVIAIGYQCRVSDEEVKLSHEHQDFKWISKEKFMEMDVGEDGGFIKAILGN